MAMELYLNTYGAYLHKVDDMFEIKIEDTKTKISPKKVKSIIITTGITLSSDVIVLAVKNNIDIVILDDYGEVTGRFWHSKFGSTAHIRRKQLEFFQHEKATEYAKEIIVYKIENSVSHIKKIQHNRPGRMEYFQEKIKEIEYHQNEIKKLRGSIDDLRNILMAHEGNAGRIYYEVIAEIIPKEFLFSGRSFRPAKDYYNCMLNYGFGILYNRVEKALIVAGLDPFVGIIHVDNYNKKSLVFDVIEIFRYYVWEVVQKLFSQKKVNKAYFDHIYGGYRLNKDGKKLLAHEINEFLSEKIKFDNRQLERGTTIQAYCHKLANSLIEDKKEEADAGLCSL